MASVCLVLDELYPFSSGGIGRLAHNLIQYERERGEHELHLLVTTRCAIDPAAFTATFGPSVQLHRVDLLPTPKQRLAWWWRDGETLAHQGLRESHAIFDALQRLTQEGRRFDFIEFTDFLGWGAVSVEQRAALGHARVVVRLHAGFGFLASLETTAKPRKQKKHPQEVRKTGRKAEQFATFLSSRLPVKLSFEGFAAGSLGKRPLTRDDYNQAQLEKRAVANADLVVAHVPGAARQLFRYYFGEDVRAGYTTIALPPVVWPRVTTAPVVRRSTPDILFLSKIQAVKNPELFIDACSAFFDRHPSYPGRAELACHAMEPDYRSRVLARIPARWAEKIVWRSPLSAAEWRERVPGSIVVVPSIFESLCLLAYEAIATGAVTCVNTSCSAFGDDSPLVDGENCLKFEPNAPALAEVLERAAFAELQLQSRLPTPDAPYWEN